MGVKENRCLNFLKGISCLTVVLLHCPLPGIVGDCIIYAFRFPVPIFFMVSGYFCYYRGLDWIRHAQLKILRLLLCSEAICGIVSFAVREEGIAEQLREVPLWEHPFRTLFCGTLFNGTLWYLYAMFWTWGILYVVKRLHLIRQSCFLIPILLALHILGRLYIQKAGDMDIDVWIYLFRSPLLYGIPFVLSGHLVAEREEQIRNRYSLLKNALLLLLGGAVMIVEFMVWRCFMDIWFSTILIATALFLFAVRHPEMSILPGIAEIGKRYSMVVYVSHIPLSRIMGRCIKPFMGEAVYSWTAPFLIMAAALLTAGAAGQIKAKVGRRAQPETKRV